jgi:hypothetical protein
MGIFYSARFLNVKLLFQVLAVHNVSVRPLSAGITLRLGDAKQS